jgi:hypothetical protein
LARKLDLPHPRPPVTTRTAGPTSDPLHSAVWKHNGCAVFGERAVPAGEYALAVGTRGVTVGDNAVAVGDHD